MARRVIPKPFAYPRQAHIRRHGPGGWKDYQKYRQWLRDEFTFRCVYCLERERWRDMRGTYQIDHFQPQILRPDLECDYDNLLYLCPACNNKKRDFMLPDPCSVALGNCLRVHKNGSIEALNDDGKLLVDVLVLDDPRAEDFRRMLIGTLLSLAKCDWNRFVDWMRYPNDLPDLAQTPPPSNSRLAGIAESHFEKRKRGELGEVY